MLGMEDGLRRYGGVYSETSPGMYQFAPPEGVDHFSQVWVEAQSGCVYAIERRSASKGQQFANRYRFDLARVYELEWVRGSLALRGIRKLSCEGEPGFCESWMRDDMTDNAGVEVRTQRALEYLRQNFCAASAF